jgi:non-heme chloroperoxidase
MPSATPVVLIPGMWIHSSAWTSWIPRFEAAGYAPVAVGWPGEAESAAATRRRPSAVAGSGLQDITDHYARFIGGLPEKPIVIGHSFGGLVAQKLLANGLASAVIAIDPAPIKGTTKLPIAQIRSVLPVLMKKSNRAGAVSLTSRHFRYAFGNRITKAESRKLFDLWSIPAPGKPIFEVTAAKKDPQSPTAVDTKLNDRGPLLITGGEFDHTVPEIVARQAFELYSRSTAVTEYKKFAGRGHALTMDAGWSEVADFSLQWLQSHALAPVTGGA